MCLRQDKSESREMSEGRSVGIEARGWRERAGKQEGEIEIDKERERDEIRQSLLISVH